MEPPAVLFHVERFIFGTRIVKSELCGTFVSELILGFGKVNSMAEKTRWSSGFEAIKPYAGSRLKVPWQRGLRVVRLGLALPYVEA